MPTPQVVPARGRRDVLADNVLGPDATTSLSLWLDRYAPELKQEALTDHHTAALDKIRVPEGYTAAFKRRERALRELQGTFFDGVTRLYTLHFISRAVVGIGVASVRETNLSLLRPWGVPFIPGSSLKGLAAHVAAEQDSTGGPWSKPEKPGERAGEYHQAIFGDVNGAGAVIFHDAWWVPSGDQLPVQKDTMTVHHREYYEGQDERGPADWDSPNPVGFLTMNGTYRFALTGPAQALDVAAKLLEVGLLNEGIGAKTAAGYGRAKQSLHVSDLRRSLKEFPTRAARANDVGNTAQRFADLAAKAEFPDERQAASDLARALFEKSPQVWRDWLRRQLDQGNTRPELERYFGPLLAPVAAAQATPRAPEPAAPNAEDTPTYRRVRVTCTPERHNAKRYEIRVDGDSRRIKHHLLEYGENVFDALRAAGEVGLVVDVRYEGGKPKAISRADDTE